MGNAVLVCPHISRPARKRKIRSNPSAESFTFPTLGFHLLAEVVEERSRALLREPYALLKSGLEFFDVEIRRRHSTIDYRVIEERNEITEVCLEEVNTGVSEPDYRARNGNNRTSDDHWFVLFGDF